MRKRKACLFVLFLLFCILFPYVSYAAAENETGAVVDVYFTSDVNGCVYSDNEAIGYARFKAYITENTQGAPLILDAGNTFTGSAYANLTDGKSIANIMAQTGYDAYTPGENDYSYGIGMLKELIDSTGAVGLSAVVSDQDLPLAPYAIFEKSDIKIGVIGAGALGISAGNEKDAAAFTPDKAKTIDSIRNAVTSLQAAEVSAVILLSHLDEDGILAPEDIALEVTGIDLIINGGTAQYGARGTAYSGYIAQITPPILSTAANFNTFGAARLSFDEEDKLTDISFVSVDHADSLEYAPDRELTALIARQTQELRKDVDEVIAYTPVFLNGEPEYSRTQSCSFGSVGAASVKEYTGADVAIIDASEFNASIPVGDITFGTLYNAVADNSYVYVAKITGAQLEEYLDRYLVYDAEYFPQVAGFSFQAEQYVTEHGSIGAELTEMTKNGQSIHAEDALTLAMTEQVYMNFCELFSDTPASKSYVTLFDTIVFYLNNTDEKTLTQVCSQPAMIIWAQTIDPEIVISQLETQVPESVNIYLKQSAILPDSIVYYLIQSGRTLNANVQNEGRPYCFHFNGAAMTETENINLYASVSQNVPAGKRTASSADKNAVFIDLTGNLSLPANTQMSVYLGDVYPPATPVYLYYYDTNRDIIPLDVSGLTVDENGFITISADSDTTYLVNSQLLNASTVFETPTPDRPFIPGMILMTAVFFIWVACFLISKKRAKNKDCSQE